MPLHFQSTDKEYTLAVWKVTETLDELLRMLPESGERYVQTLATFQSDTRKTEWIAVRTLLYTLLGQLPEVLYLPTGKPFLLKGVGHISISHTKGYVAVIFSRSCEVGIDIEQISERVHRVMPKFMRHDELPSISYCSETFSMLLIWSAKEVMFKRMGVEGVDFLEHLYVQLPAVEAETTSFKAFSTHPDCTRAFLIHYLSDADFVLTWSAGNFSGK